MPYAVYADKKDVVWLTDFGSNAFIRFDPTKEIFTEIKIPSAGANVRQILGVPDEDGEQNQEQTRLSLLKQGRDCIIFIHHMFVSLL